MTRALGLLCHQELQKPLLLGVDGCSLLQPLSELLLGFRELCSVLLRLPNAFLPATNGFFAVANRFVSLPLDIIPLP